MNTASSYIISMAISSARMDIVDLFYKYGMINKDYIENE